MNIFVEYINFNDNVNHAHANWWLIACESQMISLVFVPFLLPDSLGFL